MEITVWKQYFELVVQYGIPVAFTATTLGLLIWIAVVFIKVIKRYLPLWFETSIRSHERLCDNVDILTASILCIHEVVHVNYDGLASLVDALHTGASDKEMKERLGLKSDVIQKLRDAHVKFREWRGHNNNRQSPGDEEADFERQVEALRKRRAEIMERKSGKA